MVGMQSQISQLTNIFEKSMSTPDGGIAAKRSLTISQIQEFEKWFNSTAKGKDDLKISEGCICCSNSP